MHVSDFYEKLNSIIGNERANLVRSLAGKIDTTNLRANSTKKDIEKLCLNAVKYRFYSVCVNPYWVHFCKDLLKGSGVKISCVVGFPLGATSSKVKAYEAELAVRSGADEIDMVARKSSYTCGRTLMVQCDKAAVDIPKELVEFLQDPETVIKVQLIYETP